MRDLDTYDRDELVKHATNLRGAVQHFARRLLDQEERRSQLAHELMETEILVRRLERDRRLSPAGPLVVAVTVIAAVALGCLLAFAFAMGGIYR